MKGQSSPFLNVRYSHLADIPIASSNARNATAKVCTSLAGKRFDLCSEGSAVGDLFATQIGAPQPAHGP